MTQFLHSTQDYEKKTKRSTHLSMFLENILSQFIINSRTHHILIRHIFVAPDFFFKQKLSLRRFGNNNQFWRRQAARVELTRRTGRKQKSLPHFLAHSFSIIHSGGGCGGPSSERTIRRRGGRGKQNQTLFLCSSLLRLSESLLL